MASYAAFYPFPRNPVPNGLETYDFPTSKIEKEEIVRFIHARLPCVPIKVIRANSLDPDAKVYRMRTNDDRRLLVGAVVFKDHPAAEFREVKYFATAYQGGGFGRKLMDALKTDAVIQRLFYIVLYASNTAVQFFEKQNFLKFPEQIKGLSRSVVLARVEQYQRSTLMACDLIDLFPNDFKGIGIKMKIGTEVLVSHGLRHAREEEGVVVEVKPPLKVKVSYPKWTQDTDEWIVTAAKRIRVKKQQLDLDDALQVTDPDGCSQIRVKKIRII